MKIFLKLFRESYLFALHEIAVNRVRTFLSLLGITIGIFSVISIFTVFDTMELTIRNSINSLGNDILFVQKWPWEFGPDFPWWKYMKRPEPTLADLREIENRCQTAEAATMMVSVQRTVKYYDNSIENVPVNAVSQDYDKVMTVDIQYGRFISPAEYVSGKAVAVIGSGIATDLFRMDDAVGLKMRLFGINAEVIGVMEKKGKDIFGNSPDYQVFIPINFGRNYIDIREVGSAIVVKAKPMVSLEELKDDLTGVMRSVRKLKPVAENDFAINEMDLINREFEQLFSVIAVVGWIIGGFSLLVGGFGIANIMFVSVKERTNIIGIQKSLGAKNYFILFQFLFESVFLSLLGGVVGLLTVYVLTLVVASALDMHLILTWGNILLGIGVSAFIGFVSGLIPAWTASRLDPVEAMRSTF